MNRIQRLFMGTGRNMGIIVTAWREALLVGAQEVTPDHLLTALAVSGGPAAELLARHGVTVARLREATHTRDVNDLASLGIDASTLGQPPRRSIAQLWSTTPKLEMSPLTEQLVKSLQGAGGELEALRTLIDHPTTGAAEALRGCRVDIEALRADLDADTSAIVHGIRHVAPIPGLLDGLVESTVAVTRFVPVDIERLATVTRSPELVVQWFYGGPDVHLDEQHRILREQKAATIELRKVVDERTGDRLAIAWQEHWSGNKHHDPRGYYLHLLMQPAGMGTRITFTRGFRGFGRGGRVIARLSAELSRLSVNPTIQNLVQVAEDE
ncbi:Clp protease N-terminal domain-containing protein [Micrococcus luteus]|uniref:Clp protease N-terminal domain-containing protein n=1 Tax=Micrococcus luteus TaxID=1270 RepID=UPI0036A4ABC6